MSVSQQNLPVLLFSHGFGIRKDNLGLFTFLSERFNDLGYTTVLFDYYDFNEDTKEIYTVPFSKQAEILQQHINKIRAEYPGREINIIAQSQGSIVPTFCDLVGVSRVVGISPFFLTNKDTVQARYLAKHKTEIDFSSISRRGHSDGSVTIIPPEYWQERFETKVENRYNDLAKKTDITLICGSNDETMNETDLRDIKYARIINTDANHDFTGEHRDMLFKLLARELT